MAGIRRMAAEVRTRLMGTAVIDSKNVPLSVLDTIEHKKTIRQHVREFACIFAIIACGFSAYAWYYQGSMTNFVVGFAVAGGLIATGYGLPIALYPVWKAWMTLAIGLGFIVTTVILFVMWLGVFIPLALLLRVIGKHVMDTTFDRSIPSYWNERDEKFHDFKLLERQF